MNAWVHTNTKPQISSTRRRGPGWRIHGSVEDTKLSTNKQHSLSVCVYYCRTYYKAVRVTKKRQILFGKKKSWQTYHPEKGFQFVSLKSRNHAFCFKVPEKPLKPPQSLRIAPMNRTYRVELPEYQNTENPKYQKSKVPNTLMRPYIFVTRF